MLRADYLKLGRPVLMRGATLANGPRSAVPSGWGDWRAAMQRDDFLAAHGGRTFLTSAIPYGRLNHRTAARTLFDRPYLAHFCPVFSRFFAVFSVLTPGFQKVAPKDRGSVP